MEISEENLLGWLSGARTPAPVFDGIASYTGIIWLDYDGKPLWSKTVLDTPEKTVITETIYKKNING